MAVAVVRSGTSLVPANQVELTQKSVDDIVETLAAKLGTKQEPEAERALLKLRNHLIAAIGFSDASTMGFDELVDFMLSLQVSDSIKTVDNTTIEGFEALARALKHIPGFSVSITEAQQLDPLTISSTITTTYLISASQARSLAEQQDRL